MKKEYNLINVLKFICAILVVIIHTANRESEAGYLFVVISRVAVPIFFIITGYFMYDEINNKDFRKVNKHALKILNIYIIWSIVYIICVHENYFWSGSVKGIAFNLIYRFIFLGTYDHLWYLITCFASIYIIYFMVNKLGLNFSVFLSIILYSFALLGDSYYGVLSDGIIKSTINVYISLFGEIYNGFSWVLIFIFIGMIIKKYNLNEKITKYKTVIFILYCLFIVEHLILKNMNIVRDNNTSITLLLLAPTIFMYVVSLEGKIKSEFVENNSILLKKMSLTIYVVHPLIELYITRYTGLHKSFAFFILITVLSIIVAYILNYKKYSKRTKAILD